MTPEDGYRRGVIDGWKAARKACIDAGTTGDINFRMVPENPLGVFGVEFVGEYTATKQEET